MPPKLRGLAEQQDWATKRAALLQYLRQCDVSPFFFNEQLKIFEKIMHTPHKIQLEKLLKFHNTPMKIKREERIPFKLQHQQFYAPACLLEAELSLNSQNSSAQLVRTLLHLIDERETLIFLYRYQSQCASNPNFTPSLQSPFIFADPEKDIEINKKCYDTWCQCIKYEFQLFKTQENNSRILQKCLDQEMINSAKLQTKMSSLNTQNNQLSSKCNQFQRLLNLLNHNVEEDHPLQYKPTVSQLKDLTVATLNYGAVTQSPFQFYSKEYESELLAISQLFRKLIPRYVPGFQEQSFKQKMGKIEKTFKKGRYSNMFNAKAGIIANCFINRKDFEEQWDKIFKWYCSLQKWSMEEIETLRLYDFILYHTLLAYVYNNQNFEEVIKSNTKKFIKDLKPFYQLNILSEWRKNDNFMGYLQTLKFDVFFIQEYPQVLLDDFSYMKQKYHLTVETSNGSLVLLNRKSFTTIKKFGEVTKFINQAQKKNLRWAESISIVSADNYIFGCVHLSSNVENNGQQVANLKQDLLTLREILPQYELIIGGDLNSFMPTDPLFVTKFDLYPRNDFEFTTLKKRIFLHAQYIQGETEVKESKDRIISSLGIIEGEVKLLNGRKADATDLPINIHPHDHFIVSTKIGSKRV